MKKFILILLLILSIQCPVLADSIFVTVNDTPVEFDVSPILENGRTLVPMRAIFEALGAFVTWENDTRTAIGTRDNIEIRVPIDAFSAQVNGASVPLDVPARIIDSRTFVPARFVAEAFLCDVKWQSQSKTVIITDGNHKAVRPLSVHFIDVGQGDCILICLPNGEEVLIDAGNNGDGDEIAAYLASCGVSDIEYAIGTHPHADHIGGMDEILDLIPVKALYMPDKTNDTKTYLDVISAAMKTNTPQKEAKKGTVLLDKNGLRAELLAPKHTHTDEINNVSVVLRLTYINRTFLFMGDAEKPVEETLLPISRADVLKVGHHGSSTSSSPDFVADVNPAFAVISCGSGNRYGHPHTETLTRFASLGTKVLRTDYCGTITFFSDGDTLTYQTAA